MPSVKTIDGGVHSFSTFLTRREQGSMSSGKHVLRVFLY
jgi:hypothetical protein